MPTSNIRYDLTYDGRTVLWRNHGAFRATSGLRGFQDPSRQCDHRGGPIPEGSYFFLLREDRSRPEADANCNLLPAWSLQEIPRGEAAGM